MGNMFTNPRDQRYIEDATRNMGDGMSEQHTKEAAAAWNKAFKDIAPIDTGGFDLTIKANGQLTISKGGAYNQTLTMDFTEFQTVAQAAMKLFAAFSDQEQTLTLRAKP